MNQQRNLILKSQTDWIMFSIFPLSPCKYARNTFSKSSSLQVRAVGFHLQTFHFAKIKFRTIPLDTPIDKRKRIVKILQNVNRLCVSIMPFLIEKPRTLNAKCNNKKFIFNLLWLWWKMEISKVPFIINVLQYFHLNK